MNVLISSACMYMCVCVCVCVCACVCVCMYVNVYMCSSVDDSVFVLVSKQ